MPTTAHSPEALRKHHVAQLAHALRAHLRWQAQLAADGAPRPDADALQQWEARVKRAQQAQIERQRRALAAPEPAIATPKPEAPPDRPARPKPLPADEARPNPRKPAAANAGQNVLLSFLRASQELPARTAEPAPSGPITLDAVRNNLGDCQRCKLHATRSNIVFGVGDPNARLIFIGEAPGFHEDRTGEPFVGKAGELLTRMIQAMGLRRDEVYICNIIKCRPPGNRDPEPDELSRCEPFLIQQLRALRPQVIVTLGRFAAQALLRRDTSITRLRGQWNAYQGVPVMPTLHPAYLLRNPESKREVWADLQQVMQRLKEPSTAP